MQRADLVIADATRHALLHQMPDRLLVVEDHHPLHVQLAVCRTPLEKQLFRIQQRVGVAFEPRGVMREVDEQAVVDAPGVGASGIAHRRPSAFFGEFGGTTRGEVSRAVGFVGGKPIRVVRHRCALEERLRDVGHGSLRGLAEPKGFGDCWRTGRCVVLAVLGRFRRRIRHQCAIAGAAPLPRLGDLALVLKLRKPAPHGALGESRRQQRQQLRQAQRPRLGAKFLQYGQLFGRIHVFWPSKGIYGQVY